MTLQTFFQQNPKVAVAFSGGTDSAFLLYAARQYAKEVHAYYVRSAFQPQFEYNDAVELAKQLDVSLTVIQVDVLSSPVVTANPPDRCYHCKKVIFSKITKAAAQDGFLVLLDGTNASDDASDRPGMKALQELKVLSPLRECELTKNQIRELSKKAGLFTWNKPAYACLATRIPTGCTITAERLSKTERAENFLMTLGFSDFRVSNESYWNVQILFKITSVEVSDSGKKLCCIGRTYVPTIADRGLETIEWFGCNICLNL